MKRLFISLFLTFLTLVLPAQQAKRVFITLDVSGSMTGDKYILANYTSQMIVTLCDDQDEVNLFIYGIDKRLSGLTDPLKPIQKPMDRIMFGQNRGSSYETQFGDIMGFNSLYSPSPDKEDWLFIVGDGDWFMNNPRYQPDKQKFREIVESGTVNVCYLQTSYTLDDTTDFTQFADSLDVIDILKSDNNPQTVRDGCHHFARKILGFSDIPFTIDKSGSNGIELKSELPIQSFYLVYQDETTPSNLPSITSVSAGGHPLEVRLKGTPTTLPLKEAPGDGIDLSGQVWLLKAGESIPANETIQVSFDQRIDPSKINVYPLLADLRFASFGVSASGGKLKQLDSRTFCISRRENKAVVRIELNGAGNEVFPDALLRRTKVVIKANGKEYAAKFKNGGFEGRIDLEGPVTQYYAECDCPGYFKRVTPITSLIKGDCDPEPEEPAELPTQELAAIEFEPMTFEQLKNDPIRFYIHNEGETEALDPTRFDIEIEVENGYLYEKPRLGFDGGIVLLDLRPKGEWCECFFPEDVHFKIISTPKPGAFDAEGRIYSRVVKPGHVRILKDRPWFSRCFWVILTLIALVFFMLYLRALLKKNRFHKHARIKNSYVTDDSPREEERNGLPLRTQTFGAWINRWLNPFGDEKTTMSFHRPKTRNMTFIASPSKNRIFLKESSFDPKTMIVPNYTPQPNGRKGKDGQPISISSGLSIEIKTQQGYSSARAGHLKYVAAGKDDEAGYRFFLGILMALSIVSFITLVFLLIKGI